MYLHSENPRSWHHASLILHSSLFILLFLLPSSLFPQTYPVTVSIAVAPPYPPHISDYTSQPNKIMATLINTSTSTKKVYVHGIITGEGNIKVYTTPSWKMPTPLYLVAGVPFQMNLNNIQQVFDENHLTFEGISKNEIIYGNGLPEGNYTICLQAFDYDSDTPLSAPEPLGCSNNFNVSDVEVPVILQPVCGDTLTPASPQVVTFTWTRPPGSPFNVQYILKIIEVLPSDRNINDAIQSAVHPVFLEKTVSVNNYVLGPADPSLVFGKTYAFNVTAVDPLNKITFRNNGTSEACSFIYGQYKPVVGGGENVTPKPSVTPGNVSELEQQFSNIPVTTISGRILCKFPHNPDGPVTIGNEGVILNPNVGPVIPGQGHTYSYGSVVGASLGVMGNVGINSVGLGFNSQGNNGASPVMNDWAGPIIQQMKARKYFFEATENTNFTKPLANAWIKLVVRIAFVDGVIGKDFPEQYNSRPLIDAIDLNGVYYHNDAIKYVNVVLDAVQTDEDGNFTFTFQAPFITGPMVCMDMPPQTPPSKILTPEDIINILPGAGGGGGWNIWEGEMGGPGGEFYNTQKKSKGVGPAMFMSPEPDPPAEVKSNKGYFCLKVEVENQKFCSPDIDIFAMPGDVINLPVQEARLKTYDLTVHVISSNRPNQKNGMLQPLGGIKVAIMRDTNTLKYEFPPIIPFEGKRLGTLTYNNNGVFRNVDIDTTDASGNAIMPNLVRQTNDIDPQYLISLKSRDFVTASTQYENTLFNYADKDTSIAYTSGTSALGRCVYNHEYTSPTKTTITYIMDPLPPEIKGRVIMKNQLQVSGMPNIWVDLRDQPGDYTYKDLATFINQNTLEKAIQTNESGFFRFTNLSVNENQDNAITGPFRRVMIMQPGFDTYISPVLSQSPYLLQYGLLKDLVEIELHPTATFIGFVQDEDGNPVPSYVKTNISPFDKTTKDPVTGKEYFNLPSLNGSATVTVNPLSSQYFDRDTVINNTAQSPVITVFKRYHRPWIVVKDEHGIPVKDVSVNIENQSSQNTNASGVAYFKFLSESDQFIIHITPSANYVPILESIDIPVSKGWTTYNYILKAAKSISGTITDKSNGAPLPGAQIYSELAQADGTVLYIQAIAQQDGSYILNGIPKNLSTITVHVVKGGSNPSYIGQVQTLNLNQIVKIGTQVHYNFALERANGWDLSYMWGFPIAVESFSTTAQGLQPGQALISGYFVLPPTIQGFSLQQMELKLPFSNVVVKKNNAMKPEPTGNSVTIQTLDIPVRVEYGLTGDLMNITHLGTGYNIITGTPDVTKTNLALTINGYPQGTAGIKGHLKMNLASFRFNYDYHGELYLGDDTIEGKTTVFANNPVPGTGNKQFIFGLSTNVKPVPVSGYTVFKFPASEDMAHSTRDGGTLRLRTILHTQIPGCGSCAPLDLAIHAGDVVITSNDMNFEESPQELLNFQLEQWKVNSQKPWVFDKNTEAFVLPEVIINTGQGVDARVHNMKLWPNALYEGDIDINGGLTLGGILDLKILGNLKPVFNYDYGVGHYRISVIGEAGQVAGIAKGLPNTSPNQITFQNISLLSDNENVLKLNQSFTFYNIVNLDVDQIMTGPGFFKLDGQLTPNWIPNLTAPGVIVTYTKPGNSLKCTVETIKGFVECKGNVEFFFDQVPEAQSVTNGQFTTYGNVKVNPGNGKSGDPFYFRGFLTKTSSACGIEIINVDDQGLYKGLNEQKMIAGSNVFHVIKGKTEVQSNDWTLLQYSVNTTSIEGLNKPGSNNVLDFTVNGDIGVTSSAVSITNIDVPSMGTLSLVYNFDDKSLRGSLTNDNLNLGFGSLEHGIMTVCFDSHGFYFVVGGQVTIGVGLSFAGGFILGATSTIRPEDYQPLLASFNPVYRPDFSSGLHGFYLIGERKFIDKTFRLVIAIGAQAGIGTYVTADFSSNPVFLVGGYGYASFYGGITVPLCGFFGVCTGALMEVKGGYVNHSIDLDACGMLYIAAVACHLSLGVTFHLDVGYNNGFTCDVGLGACEGAANPVDKTPCKDF